MDEARAGPMQPEEWNLSQPEPAQRRHFAREASASLCVDTLSIYERRAERQAYEDGQRPSRAILSCTPVALLQPIETGPIGA